MAFLYRIIKSIAVSYMPAVPRLFGLCLLSLACFLTLTSLAKAQLIKTSHLELTEDTHLVHIGPYMWQSFDPDDQLTAQNIYVRHKSQNLGVQHQGTILHLPAREPKRWLSLEVTNRTNIDRWFLDFGNHIQGRFGTLHALSIYNHNTNEEIINAQGAALDALLWDGGFPLVLAPGSRNFLSIHIKASGPMPATFNLTLSPQQSAHSLWAKPGYFITIFFIIGFFLLSAFFLSQYYMERAKRLPLVAAYFFCPVLFLFIGQFHGPLIAYAQYALMSAGLIFATFFTGHKSTQPDQNSAQGYEDGFSISNSILVSVIVATTLVVLIPFAPISFLQKSLYLLMAAGCVAAFMQRGFQSYQRNQLLGVFAVVAWGLVLIGLFFTALGFSLLQGQSPFFMNAYLYFLLPHGVFVALGIAMKIKHKQQEKIDQFAKKNRAAQALARLQQSKDSADQARLLRVIERERELMADLREQEAFRTEEMRRAKEEADAANAAKSAFLAVISHEIRTPMNGIMGILRLMQGTNLSKEQSDYLLTMHKTGDTMVALLNDILDFEKIDTGKMELEQINIDLHGLLHGIVTLMTGYVSGKDVELRCDIGPHVPNFIIGDPTRIRQVLLNLVSNAIKFTEQGHVTVRVEAQALIDKPDTIKADYEITFAVEDTGAGISEEAQKTLFDPFQQADSSVARNYGGSGLGLAISMRLVEIMGSSIGLESQVGKGSCFSFTLLFEEGYDENSASAISAQDDAPQLSLAKPLTVLVVEDNEINRKVLQNLLEKDGHRTFMAESAEKALHMLPDIHADIIFMDINLTGMNGMEAARTIRMMDDQALASLPIIGITGNVRAEDKEAIYKAGMNGVVTKPIDYSDIQLLLAETSRKIEAMKTENLPPSADRNTAPAQKTELQQGDLSAADEAGQQGETASPTPALDADYYNAYIIDNLVESLGQDTMNELMRGCIEKVEEIFGQLDEAFANNDMELLHARMHELKGMAHNFGLQALGDQAKIGEDAAREGNLPPIVECYEAMKPLYKKALEDFS